MYDGIMHLTHLGFQEFSFEVSIVAVQYLSIDILKSTWFMSIEIQKRGIYIEETD